VPILRTQLSGVDCVLVNCQLCRVSLCQLLCHTHCQIQNALRIPHKGPPDSPLDNQPQRPAIAQLCSMMS
jgi:hypothetical protein